jgi:hypothetical protein
MAIAGFGVLVMLAAFVIAIAVVALIVFGVVRLVRHSGR